MKSRNEQLRTKQFLVRFTKKLAYIVDYFFDFKITCEFQNYNYNWIFLSILLRVDKFKDLFKTWSSLLMINHSTALCAFLMSLMRPLETRFFFVLNQFPFKNKMGKSKKWRNLHLSWWELCVLCETQNVENILLNWKKNILTLITCW